MKSVYREGSWDCSNCGMTGIRASKKECPRCKDPQNSVLTPSEDWYLPADAPVIDVDTPEKLVTLETPAWNCGYCGVLNDGDTTVCSHCNQPLDFNDTVNRKVTYDDAASSFDVRPDPRDEMIESDLDKADRAIQTKASKPRVMKDLTLPGSSLRTIGEDTVFYDDIRHKAESRFDERLRLGQLPPIMQKLYPFRKAIAIGAALLLAISLVTGIVLTVRHFTATTPGTVTISELHWQRGVEVEEYKTLNQSDWDHPGDARIQSSEPRFHYNRTVHDGWRTETYTDTETRYRTETYTGTETRYRTETYSDTCSRTVSNGNGSYRTDYYSCSKTRQVSYQVPVQKTRQVPYQVPVQKTRQVEITHQEPVYDIWYVYQIDRWVTDRWVNASDETSPKVIWPEVSDLHRDATPGDQVGEERVGDERTQSYTIIFTDQQGKSHTEKSGNDDLWRKLEKGESVKADYYQRNGELHSVDWASVS